MVDRERVEVFVWQHLSGSLWGQVGEIDKHQSLSFEDRYLRAGPWTLQASYDGQSAKVNRQSLLTFGFRDMPLYTGLVEHLGPQSDVRGKVTYDLAGVNAVALLEDPLAWPEPAVSLPSQQFTHYELSGVAEDVLSTMIRQQYGRLYDGGVYEATVAASRHRGASIEVRNRYRPLLQSIQYRCEVAELKPRVRLVPTAPGSTRANLTIDFEDTTDLSERVHLSQQIGTLKSWSQYDEVPQATRGIVAGAADKQIDRPLRQAIAADAEDAWGRRRETFIDARDMGRPENLPGRGDEELSDLAQQSSFNIETDDAAGMRYGRLFGVGDQVTVELAIGLPRAERLGAATVTSDSGGIKVSLKPGDPEADPNPLYTTGTILRRFRRWIRDLQQED